jgi:hypothetical protein
MKNKKSSLVEFVTSSPINEAFVLQAAIIYANTVANPANRDDIFAMMKNSFFAPGAWIQIAEDFIAEVEPPKAKA